ncbi:MAG: YdcF family protein [Oscillospiraceae bacterium]|nr:YdcF family protein [Oscillospiraceae bacterium]
MAELHKPHRKLVFYDFSMQRKIVAGFFLAMFILTVVFIFIDLNGETGFGIGMWFPPVYFFALFIVTYNLNRFKTILRKAYKPLIYLFYIGMILFVTAFAVYCFVTLSYTADDIPENPDLVIVLGCHVYGDKPGKLLETRLSAALDTLNKYPGAVCITTGGQGPSETAPEARTMKKYLSDNGIGANRIYEDDRSSTSFENLSFAEKIAIENNLKYQNIIVVTSEYHIFRAMMIAHRVYPDANIYAVKANSPFAFFTSGMMREFFAFVKSFIIDRTGY